MWTKERKQLAKAREVLPGVTFTPAARPRHPLGKALGGGLASLLALTVLLTLLPLVAVSGVAAAGVMASDVWKNMPSSLPEVAIAQRNTIFDKNGSVIAETWVEDRVEVDSLESISPWAIQGLVATEDKRFFETQGFDPMGTLRALLSGKGGGSGITQQLVKNLQFYNLLGKEKKEQAVEASLVRKVKELRLALAYAEDHSKEEILLTYFNTVAFGGPNIYGIETASKYFFGKNAKDLTLAEAAALVGSANNPVLNNMNKPENRVWRDRQRVVLDRLVDEGGITKAEADAAFSEELAFVRERSNAGTCGRSAYPFYCQYVMDYVSESPRLGDTQEERDALVAKGGLQIYTYMDPKMMDEIDRYMKENWGTTNRLVAPTAVVEPGTGGVLAFGANRDWGGAEGQTQINLAERGASEGSTYKLFALAAALNNGWTEDSLAFSSYGCPLRPGRNYDSPPGGFTNSSSCELQGGYLDYKQATAWSSNTWYVTLEMKITVEKIKEFSKSVGLAAPDNITNRSLSYALGAVENSPIAVAAAFSTFSNQGVYCPATPVKSLVYSDGSSPALPDGYNPEEEACRSVMSPKNAGVVLKAMRANLSGEVPGAFGLKSNIAGYDTVAKSGTNEKYNSIWVHMAAPFTLYTNVYDMDRPRNGLAGGYFQGRRLSGNTAQTTGTALMRQFLQGTPNQPLDYNNPDKTMVQTAINQSGFFIMPSVVGMAPAEALGTMRALGVTSHVSKELRPLPPGYSSGVIVEQSVEAGTRLAKGTQKEVILYEGS